MQTCIKYDYFGFHFSRLRKNLTVNREINCCRRKKEIYALRKNAQKQNKSYTQMKEEKKDGGTKEKELQ